MSSNWKAPTNGTYEASNNGASDESNYSNAPNTASAQDFLDFFKVSPDNPNYKSLLTQAKELAQKGWTPTSLSRGIDLSKALPMGDLGLRSGGAKGFVDSLNSAQQWEGQNQGTTPAERALNSKITETANQFQLNMPKLEYTLTQQAAQAQKQLLATAIDNTQKNYNAMGLLYSNEAEGAKNQNVRDAATNTERAASDINQKVSAENEQLQQGAIQSQNTIQALNQQGAANNTNLTGQYNNISEQNQALENQAANMVGSAFGSVAGTAIGSATSGKNQNKQTSINPTSTVAGVDYNQVGPGSGLGSGTMYA